MIKSVGFLLVNPQLPENIGFCARALKNFGFKKLDIINPKEKWPNKKAIATSVGASDILNKTKIYSSLKIASNKYDIIYASTARKRDINKKHLSFKQFIESIKKNRNKKIGILFGPEASGLSNEDIGYSNYIFKIPVHKKFESLNLSHSLIIVAQSIFQLLNMKNSKYAKSMKVKTASKKNIQAMTNLCIKHLEEINFFKPKEKKPKMLENLRSIFYKMDLSEKETRILSSVFASLAKKKAD